MRTRVVTVDAAAEHGDRRARRIERAAMCAAVDPAREARDDDDTGGGELARELARDVRAVVGAAAHAARASSFTVAPARSASGTREPRRRARPRRRRPPRTRRSCARRGGLARVPGLRAEVARRRGRAALRPKARAERSWSRARSS